VHLPDEESVLSASPFHDGAEALCGLFRAGFPSNNIDGNSPGNSIEHYYSTVDSLGPTWIFSQVYLAALVTFPSRLRILQLAEYY
jgi:hypothetical protein